MRLWGGRGVRMGRAERVLTEFFGGTVDGLRWTGYGRRVRGTVVRGEGLTFPSQRHSEGDLPVIFLKVVLKVVLELNPASYPMASRVNCAIFGVCEHTFGLFYPMAVDELEEVFRRSLC